MRGDEVRWYENQWKTDLFDYFCFFRGVHFSTKKQVDLI